MQGSAHGRDAKGITRVVVLSSGCKCWWEADGAPSLSCLVVARWWKCGNMC